MCSNMYKGKTKLEISVASVKDVKNFATACEKLVKDPQVRHAAVINKLGRNIASSIKAGITPLIDDEKLRTVYMQLYLDFSMRKELDEKLGPIHYIVSRRKNVTMINIPTNDYLILVVAEPNSDDKKIIKKAEEVFDILPAKL